MKKYSLYISLITIILLASDCEYKDLNSCGCQGNTIQSIAKDAGIMVKVHDDNFDGFRFLSVANGYLDFCSDIPNDLLVDGLMVKVSGVLNLPCIKSKDPLFDPQHYPFKIEEYTIQSDSLFKSPPITINIFSSVTPNSSGFGYEVKQQPGIHIIQPTIPAIGGLVTFSNRTKAFKVAVLVAHKLSLHQGLPSLDINDLEYLQSL